MRFVIICMMSSVIFSCGSIESDCDISFGTSFEVQSGDSYCLPDGSLLVISSITDSYCPCNANCIWQGEAVIIGERVIGEKAESFEIHESLTESNPPYARISTVTMTTSCNPDVSMISIIVTE